MGGPSCMDLAIVRSCQLEQIKDRKSLQGNERREAWLLMVLRIVSILVHVFAPNQPYLIAGARLGLKLSWGHIIFHDWQVEGGENKPWLGPGCSGFEPLY